MTAETNNDGAGGSIREDSPYLRQRRQVAVFVDPYSTGCIVAQEMQKRGFLIIALWTATFADAMKLHVPKTCGRMDYFAQVDQQGTLEETKQALLKISNGHAIAAVIAGGEAGVDYADALSEYFEQTRDSAVDTMPILTNGTEIPNRRDKYVQQELIKQAGLRGVRQAGSDKFEEVESFLKTESFPVVLKPTESAGSDGVKLCYGFDEAQEHFHKLMSSQLVNGGDCPSVLCQEFLKGTEYVVDHVSKDGVHKTCMVWVYDKRKANGSNFVYFGMKPVDPTTEQSKILINYTRRVLDAMGILHGPTHAEIMMTAEGPCLVEMNCRAHGGDGCWRPLACALTGGYSQVEVSAYAFVDPKAFAKVPDKPPYPFKAYGQEVIFVNNSRGKVKSTPGYDVIQNMPSFVHMDGLISPGAEVDYTVDLITGIGSVIVMHKDHAVVKRDIEFIRYLEEINGFFVYETKLENLKRPRGEAIMFETAPPISGGMKGHMHRRVFSSDGPFLIRHMSNDRPELRGPLVKRMTTVDSSQEAVVIVDPYSTGCCVAEEITKRGFSVIALWTRGFAPEMKTHVPLSCGPMKYFAEVEEADTLIATSEAVYNAAGRLRVVACLAGKQIQE